MQFADRFFANKVKKLPQANENKVLKTKETNQNFPIALLKFGNFDILCLQLLRHFAFLSQSLIVWSLCSKNYNFRKVDSIKKGKMSGLRVEKFCQLGQNGTSNKMEVEFKLWKHQMTKVWKFRT